MKNTKLKTLVNLFIVFITIVYVNDFLSKYDYDLFKFADSYDREHELGKYSKTDIPTNKSDEVYQESVQQNEIEQDKSKEIIYVHGFGVYNQNDLENIKEGVKEFYGLDVVIDEPYTSPSGYYFVDGGEYLNAFRVLELSENVSGRHIYVTDHPLYDNEDNRKAVSGWARFYHNSCIVSSYQMIQYGNYNSENMVSTANHELAHNFGLEHCDNQTCLMKEKGLDTKEFCNNCKIKLN